MWLIYFPRDGIRTRPLTGPEIIVFIIVFSLIVFLLILWWIIRKIEKEIKISQARKKHLNKLKFKKLRNEQKNKPQKS